MKAAKALVAVLSQVIAQIVALGILTGNARSVLEIVAAAVTALSVYLVPNTTTASKP